MINKSPETILEAIRSYLESVELSRSINTARTYANGMQSFLETLIECDIDPENNPTSKLDESLIANFAADLKSYSPNTEQLYLSAATGFFEFAGFSLGSIVCYIPVFGVINLLWKQIVGFAANLSIVLLIRIYNMIAKRRRGRMIMDQSHIK